MKHLSIYLILFLVFVTSCKEDQILLTQTDPIDQRPIEYFEKEFNGIVTGADGNPIEGARVSSESSTSLTNGDGYFKIKANAAERRAFFKIKASGYFDSFVDLIISDKGIDYVLIQLEEKELIGQINSSSGGSVQLLNGSGVEFSPGPFQNIDLSEYDGLVNVFARYIDPTAVNFHSIFPGNLNAIDIDGNSRVLESYGMLQVELEDMEGNPLNLMEKATVTTKIPEGLVQNAPEEIPMWYFDDKHGPWIEEGMAELNGDVYVGKVSHFSLWNCDVPYPPIFLSGLVSSQFGPLDNQAIKFTWIEGNRSEIVFSSDQGTYSLKIPEGATILVEILSPCGETMLEMELGPLYEDHTEDFVLNMDPEEFLSLEGIVTCNGTAITNGYVVIDWDDYKVFSGVNEVGKFQSNQLICNSEFDLYAVDLDQAMQSDLSTYEANPPNMDLDTIDACSEEIVSVIRLHHSEGMYEIYDQIEILSITTENNLIKYASIGWTDIQSPGNWVEGVHAISSGDDYANYTNGLGATIVGTPSYEWRIIYTLTEVEGFEYTENNGYIFIDIEVDGAAFWNTLGPENPDLERIEVIAEL